MRILQLNIWSGRVIGRLERFFSKNRFDLICLQEAAWSDEDEFLRKFCVTVEQIKSLTGLEHDFRSSNWGMKILSGGQIEQGNVILSREEIVHRQTETIYGEYGVVKNLEDLENHAGTVQIVKLMSGLNIVNYHGIWAPDSMGDKRSVETMKTMGALIEKIDGPVVMCGDLNLVHDSLAMRELGFLRDLTAEYGVKSTLSGLKLDKKIACDHILVNDSVVVRDFQVVSDVVSDHLGLVIEI